MVVKQISIFVENREGRIKKALDSLAKEDINIRALSIADTSKYGLLRLIVDNNEKAIETLEKDGILAQENDVVILAVPDEPNGLNSALTLFDNNNINLEYLYAFVSNKTDEAIVVMRLENMEKAMDILSKSNLHVLDENDIKNL